MKPNSIAILCKCRCWVAAAFRFAIRIPVIKGGMSSSSSIPNTKDREAHLSGVELLSLLPESLLHTWIDQSQTLQPFYLGWWFVGFFWGWKISQKRTETVATRSGGDWPNKILNVASVPEKACEQSPAGPLVSCSILGTILPSYVRIKKPFKRSIWTKGIWEFCRHDWGLHHMTSGICHKNSKPPKPPAKLGEFEPGQNQHYPAPKNERMTISKGNNVWKEKHFPNHLTVN